MRATTDLIVVHCSDTPASMDIGAVDIRQWHIEERGWRDIGYHFVILRNGNIELGRAIGDTGAHVRGHNGRSVGICLVGGRGDDGGAAINYTTAQINALSQLVSVLSRIYPGAETLGHCNLDENKTCPNFDVRRWVRTKELEP